MFELPLFPLNTVLFPGMPLHLHIFEERYKKMVRLCLDRGVPFGVALIKQGAEALGPPAEPHPVGCTAHILEVEPLAEGRMNLVAVGMERFRTLLTDRKRAPYLTGIVEALPLVDGEAAELESAGKRLKPWLKRYLEMLAETGGIQLQAPEMPDEPHALAYLAAISLQVPNAEKQEFLSIESSTELLGRLFKTYQREVALLHGMMKSARSGVNDSFSVN
jgi:Lon protease-like protein